ncbi:MAG: ABC transporter ATP-binding protein [Rhodobacteraceae bacterium]|nr:ABC transporter ATP-binding protein [Paracoccaceae bacterium]
MANSQGAVELAAVTKSFAGSRRAPGGYCALEGVNLSIRGGEFFCLLGPSGCGKTTLLNLGAGFEAATSGRVSVVGRPVTAPGPDRGVIFQTDRALFDWLTVAENIAFGPSVRGLPEGERRQRVEEYLQLVGLTDHRSKLPRELSGGMKQRTQIARVLANEPEILLMDEPFAALDAYTRSHMQREIARIWQATGKTILFVTHDIAEALWLADRIGIMSRGPGSRVERIIEVPLPRPRAKMTEDFISIFNELSELIDAAAKTDATD